MLTVRHRTKYHCIIFVPGVTSQYYLPYSVTDPALDLVRKVMRALAFRYYWTNRALSRTVLYLYFTLLGNILPYSAYGVSVHVSETRSTEADRKREGLVLLLTCPLPLVSVSAISYVRTTTHSTTYFAVYLAPKEYLAAWS